MDSQSIKLKNVIQIKIKRIHHTINDAIKKGKT